MRRGAFWLRKTNTTSAAWPPIWSPKVPPFKPMKVGRLHPPGVRQLASPNPTFPPNPSPTCTTSGTAATHVAFSSSDWGGEWSGCFTSSAMISPARWARSASFSLGCDCACTTGTSRPSSTPSANSRERLRDMPIDIRTAGHAGSIEDRSDRADAYPRAAATFTRPGSGPDLCGSLRWCPRRPELRELHLLVLCELVLDLDQQADVGPLHLTLHDEHLVDLRERGRLIHHRLIEQLGQPLGLVLHLPLQVQHLRLELLDRSRDRGALFRLEADGALLVHHQLWRKQKPGERVLLVWGTAGTTRLRLLARRFERTKQEDQGDACSTLHGNSLPSNMSLGTARNSSAPGVRSKKSVGASQRAASKSTSTLRRPPGRSTAKSSNAAAAATARPATRPRPRDVARRGTARAAVARRRRSSIGLLEQPSQRGLAALVVGAGRAERDVEQSRGLGDRQVLVEHEVQHFALTGRQ